MTQPQNVFAAFCAAGLWPGLGQKLADALADADIHGPEDVSLERLALLPKVGPQRAGRLLSAFLGAAPAYEMVELFVPAGLSARLAARVIDAVGPDAPRLLRDDPWLLLAVPGVTLADADRVARSALPGVRRDDPRRGRALAGYVLARAAREGHTVTPRDVLLRDLAELGAADPDRAIRDAIEFGAVIEVAEGMLSPAPLAQAEDAISEGVARLIATAQPITVRRRGAHLADLDDAQRSAVHHALESGVSILTGGPGTGKSRTVAAIVALAEVAGRSVALAAPTGRAAKRLEELCGAPAATIHRLLGAQARRLSGADGDRLTFSGDFSRNAGWPLDEDIVVIDETSMLDVELAEALLEACRDGTHLIFVGDAAQLPSIGPGRVLGDLIDAGVVPTTELRTLYRQAEGGTIARLATSVRGGELPPVADPTREVVVVPARGSAQARQRVMQLVTDSIPRALGIPADQVQVVTPVHRGDAGTIALNAALKAGLNPGTGQGRFDVGDRVVATANHPECEPNGFANGEVGVVTDVAADGTVTASFASGDAEVRGKALADLTHGWAITVHRAQGSEFPAVVVVLPPEAGGMLSRPLVYTALTRAQRHLSVVHSVGPSLARAVQRVGAAPRRTHLGALLAQIRAD